MTLFQQIVLFVLGIFSGAIGAVIGSSLFLVVPALIYFGLPAPVALGTGKVSTLLRDIPALFAFCRGDKVDFKAGGLFTAAGVVGTLAGSLWALSLDAVVMERLIAVFTIAGGLYMLLKKDLGLTPRASGFSPAKARLFAVVSGGLAGLYAGLFGGGVNIVIIFCLMLIEGHDMLTAVATSKIPNIVFMLVFIVVFAVAKQIDYAAVIPLGGGMAIGGYLGARMAIIKGNQFVRHVFLLFVFILAARLLW